MAMATQPYPKLTGGYTRSGSLLKGTLDMAPENLQKLLRMPADPRKLVSN